MGWIEGIISLSGVALSALVSIFLARKTAKTEIEKLKAVWEHEKEAALDAEFDKMVSSVSMFAKRPSTQDFRNATNAVAVYQTKATGEMADAVDLLSGMIIRDNYDSAAILAQLDAVIEIKRKKVS